MLAIEEKEKICRKCGRSRPLDCFYERREKRSDGSLYIALESQCKLCKRKAVDRWWEKRREEGTAYQLKRKYEETYETLEERRQRQREWHWARRREEGIPIKGPWRKYRQQKRSIILPVGPIADFLKQRPLSEADRRSIKHVGGEKITRRIWDIEHRAVSAIALSTVDVILTGLGCSEEMHFLYPEED